MWSGRFATLPDFAHELMEALQGEELPEFFCEHAYEDFVDRFGRVAAKLSLASWPGT
jgi:hypothetical protein